jgi:hypothetical protein
VYEASSPFGSTDPFRVALTLLTEEALKVVATGAAGVVKIWSLLQVVDPGGSERLTAQSFQ